MIMFFSPEIQNHIIPGYGINVDNESKLRNQFFALQKGDNHLYVPSSTSDLYKNDIPYDKTINEPGVFNVEEFNDFNPNKSNIIGRDIFNNNTRVQLKNI